MIAELTWEDDGGKPQHDTVKQKPTGPPPLFADDLLLAYSKMVSIDEYTGVYKYRNTLAIEAARYKISQHLIPFWADMLRSIMNDFNNRGYMSQAKHRQLSALISKNADVLKAAGVDVQAILDQSVALVKYAEHLGKQLKATNNRGQVEYVDVFPADAALS